MTTSELRRSDSSSERTWCLRIRLQSALNTNPGPPRACRSYSLSALPTNRSTPLLGHAPSIARAPARTRRKATPSNAKARRTRTTRSKPPTLHDIGSSPSVRPGGWLTYSRMHPLCHKITVQRLDLSESVRYITQRHDGCHIGTRSCRCNIWLLIVEPCVGRFRPHF